MIILAFSWVGEGLVVVEGRTFLGLHLDGVAEGEVPFRRGKVQLVVVNGVRRCGEEEMGGE